MPPHLDQVDAAQLGHVHTISMMSSVSNSDAVPGLRQEGLEADGDHQIAPLDILPLTGRQALQQARSTSIGSSSCITMLLVP